MVKRAGTQQSTKDGGGKGWMTARQWARAMCKRVGGGQKWSLGGGRGGVAGGDR